MGDDGENFAQPTDYSNFPETKVLLPDTESQKILGPKEVSPLGIRYLLKNWAPKDPWSVSQTFFS